MRYGKIVSVTVTPYRQAIYCDVAFKDAMDIDERFSGTVYRYVLPENMARLARAINSTGMQVSFDEYGVATWTRPTKVEFQITDFDAVRQSLEEQTP